MFLCEFDVVLRGELSSPGEYGNFVSELIGLVGEESQYVNEGYLLIKGEISNVSQVGFCDDNLLDVQLVLACSESFVDLQYLKMVDEQFAAESISPGKR